MAERLLYAASATFESARRIDGAVAGQRLRRLHGHSFQARLRSAIVPPAREAAAPLAPFRGAEIDALRERLQDCVAPLDYQLLNEHLASPTDENLARWIRARIGLDGTDTLGIQSTRCQGVDLDASDCAYLWKRYQFESAHRLPNVAPSHKCGRMHGHGFAVILHAEVTPGAQTIDGELLDRLWHPLQQLLHHACLNDIPGLENPTSERIASWIWERIRPQLPALRWVTVYETATCGAHFDGASYRIWKELGLDSAVRLQNAPADDGRRRIHGHSYRLRLHLAAPLDMIYGWTIDFGDVQELFAPIFARLDHQPLHELPDVADAGTAAIVRWVRWQAAGSLPQLERIDLYETPGCGVILSWGQELPALPV
ncbi:6-pyruvoyl tetrahydropterin synthase [Burkholderiales bacterium]|nr:6-pyruvoyl tetrahydropterin synthase [Burkholderiales bacterium]